MFWVLNVRRRGLGEGEGFFSCVWFRKRTIYRNESRTWSDMKLIFLIFLSPKSLAVREFEFK